MKNLGIITWLVTGQSRGGRARLIGTAAGLAIGTMLLLIVFAAYQGMTDRATRADMYSYISGEHIHPYVEGEPETGLLEEVQAGNRPFADEFIILQTGFAGSESRFMDQEIIRLDIAVAPGTTATLPGIDSLPSPGTYAASPALAEIITQHPGELLEDRFGTSAGMIGMPGLPSPDTLLVVVGHDPVELANQGGAVFTNELIGYAWGSSTYAIIALIGGIAILFPVVVLIGIVTRLGQAARADRFTALGLIGATPQRIAGIAALETVSVAIVGALAGIALFLASLPIAAQVQVEGARFFAEDLVLGADVVVASAVLIIVLTTLTAYISARRTLRGSLGAVRGQAERRPHPIRIVPLLLGVAALTANAVIRLNLADTMMQDFTDTQMMLSSFISSTIIPAFAVTAFGLVLAGPLLLSWFSRAAAGRARSAEGVLALGRLARHPASTFRTVSGLIVAVFVVTVFAVGMTAADEGVNTSAVPDDGSRLPADAFVVSMETAQPEGSDGGMEEMLAAAEHAAGVSGVTGAYPVFRASSDHAEGFDPNRAILRAEDARALGLEVSPEASAISVSPEYLSGSWPGLPPILISVEVVPGQVAGSMIPSNLIVTTDGEAASIERARTALIADPLFPTLGSYLLTLREGSTYSDSLGMAQEFAVLAHIGIVIATLISAVSLAVSTMAGVIERRRALALLRLTGMPAAKLRRMITLEAAVPVATTFLLCIGLGVFVAWALITGLSTTRSIGWPAPDYYLTVAVCIGLAAMAVAATFGTVRRNTAITETRFE